MLRLRTLPRGPRLPDTWTPGPPAAPVSAPESLPRTRRSRGLRCYVPINTQFPPCIYVQCMFQGSARRGRVSQPATVQIMRSFDESFPRFVDLVSGIFLACGPEIWRARCKSADGR